MSSRSIPDGPSFLAFATLVCLLTSAPRSRASEDKATVVVLSGTAATCQSDEGTRGRTPIAFSLSPGKRTISCSVVVEGVPVEWTTTLEAIAGEARMIRLRGGKQP